jgi:hypothetical protein
MNARYNLVYLAVALMLIAPALQAGEPPTRATAGPQVDCQSLKDMDYSTMDLFAVRAMERECAQSVRVAQESACKCKGCMELAQHHPRDDS